MMLTKRFFILALVSFLSVTAQRGVAQITRDTTHWNDEELYTEEDKSSPAFFSVGGGFMAGYFHPDFTTFNKNFVQPFFAGSSPKVADYREQVWMFGGGGFVTIPWIKNVRVGGMGFSGTSSDCGCADVQDKADTNTSLNRYLTYSVGYGALTIDYVLPFRMGHFHIVPGVALGYGGVDIYARQAQNRASFDVTEFTTEFDDANPYRTHTYTSHFFLYEPQIQFEYSPVGYMMFRLSAGYQGTSMGDWTVDKGLSLGNTTLFDGVNGNGLVASLGVFVGLFQ
jgi:hypothetical protein